MISKDFAVGFTFAGIKAAVPGAGSYEIPSAFNSKREDRCTMAGRSGTQH